MIYNQLCEFINFFLFGGQGGGGGLYSHTIHQNLK